MQVNRYFIDDIIFKLLEMKKDGYNYCEIYDSDGDDDIEPYLSFTAEDCGGFGGVDYESIEPASIVEVSEYAFQYKEPPATRNQLVISDEKE